jgi:GAF domain-containing protein
MEAHDDRRLDELLTVVTAMLFATELDEPLAELVRTLVRQLRYRAVIVRLLDPESGELRLVAAGGLSDAYLEKGPVAPSGSNLDARVLAGEVVELGDVTCDPAFQYPERARAEGIRSVLALPIVIHEEPRGVLRVYTAEPHEFSRDERRLLAAVASFCGSAFERSARSGAMRDIRRDLSSTLDPLEVVDRLLRHLVERLHFSAAVVRILDEEEQRLLLAGARGLSEDYLAGERRADDPADERVLSGQVRIIHDLERQGGLPETRRALAEGIRSVLSVPLWSRGRAVGLLRVYSKRPRRFDNHEVRFVQLVAEIGGLAIENARLHAILAERVEELGAEASGWYRFLALS